MALFKRCFRLKITMGAMVKIYQELSADDESIKIDFDTSACINGNFSNGNITITGLTKSDMQFLSTNYNPQTLQLKDSKIELEAGYSGNLALILSGNVIEAEPNFTSPDQQIRLKVMSGAENNLKTGFTLKDSISKNATFKDICGKVASNNGLSLVFDNKIPNKVIGDFVFQGTPFQQIQKLREYMPLAVTISVSNKQLIVASQNAKGAKKIILDNTTGLLGTPKPTSMGCEVRMLLNPALNINDFVEIKSQKLHSLNQLYYILEMKHKGSNRADTWETNLTLRKAL